jgi:RNA polymerase primary sigma factor
MLLYGWRARDRSREQEEAKLFAPLDQALRIAAPTPPEDGDDARRVILDLLKSLTPREERVIKLRFGLDDGVERTKREVGEELHVCDARVWQIERKAMIKLRHPSRARALRLFIRDSW